MVNDKINSIQNLSSDCINCAEPADSVVVQENRYIEVFVDNGAQTPVFFDNVMVAHTQGRVLEVNAYYPYGMLIDGLSSRAVHRDEQSRYKYNGKELQTELNWNVYDYGARMQDPVTGRWWVPDKLAEKYYSISPYAYCANNPINFIDPDGMRIDSTHQAEFDRMQAQVQRTHNRLDRKLQRLQNRGVSQSRIDRVSERVNQLSQTLTNLNTLETSTQLYQLNKLDPTTNSQGYLSYNSTDNAVVINYISRSTSNFVHESTHASQFETQDIAFSNASAGGNNVIGVDLFDEVAAYKVQYGYSPRSVTGLRSNSQITGINGITSNWVQNIFNPRTNLYPYQASNIGIVPVNINTTVNTLIRAYPSVNFRGHNPNTTLRQLFPNNIAR